MKTVELIASGYEWTCPECDRLNEVMETMDIVQCKDCRKEFKVDSILHAEE